MKNINIGTKINMPWLNVISQPNIALWRTEIIVHTFSFCVYWRAANFSSLLQVLPFHCRNKNKKHPSNHKIIVANFKMRKLKKKGIIKVTWYIVRPKSRMKTSVESRDFLERGTCLTLIFFFRPWKWKRRGSYSVGFT